MNRFIQKLKYTILSSEICRRRYYIYSDKDNTVFFVKTRKLFHLPKYIKEDGAYDMYTTYRLSKAKKYCRINTLPRAHLTITQYKQNYEPEIRLPYFIVDQQ